MIYPDIEKYLDIFYRGKKKKIVLLTFFLYLRLMKSFYSSDESVLWNLKNYDTTWKTTALV